MRMEQAIGLGMAARAPFSHGSVQGRPTPNGAGDFTVGELADADLDAFVKDAPRIRYVVESYWTPIAWMLENEWWYMTRQRFSNTTQRHKAMVQREIDREYRVRTLTEAEGTAASDC